MQSNAFQRCIKITGRDVDVECERERQEAFEEDQERQRVKNGERGKEVAG